MTTIMPHPRFTIVIPVFNGGLLVQQCVRSALSQSFPDFQVLVLENGSTDGTLEWLQSLSDPRLRVYSCPHNLGIVGNWTRILTLPRGEFMTILGHDDMLDPDYFEVMNRLIYACPEATLYHAHFRMIDQNGRTLKMCSPLPVRETAAEFLTARLEQKRESFGTGYLMRSVDYDAIGGIPFFENLLFADDALWITLMLRGYKATAPQACFSYRIHTASISATATWRSHIKAMTQYVEFLKREASTDPSVAEVYRTFGPAYFLAFCRHMYLLALVEATQCHRCLAPSALSQISEALDQVDSSLASSIPSRKDLYMRKIINSHRMARLMYNLFIYLRHGIWHGAKNLNVL